jgi:hypothetical protein
MDEQTFKSLMLKAEKLAGGAYLKGYQRGLRRHYHGSSYGTEQEHHHWLSHEILGRGYRDGFAGHQPNDFMTPTERWEIFT